MLCDLMLDLMHRRKKLCICDLWVFTKDLCNALIIACLDHIRDTMFECLGNIMLMDIMIYLSAGEVFHTACDLEGPGE